MKISRIARMSILLVGVASGSAWSQELKFNTQDFAPFNYAINGVVSGPATDLIRQVCADMEITCTFDLLPWTRAQDEVRKGKANAMFVIGWNEKRAKWLHFSPPIMRTEYGIFVRKDSSLKYQSTLDMEGYKVGVYGPSNTANSLQKLQTEMSDKGLKPIKIDMRPDDEAGFKKLALGRLDAVFSNRDVGYSLIAKLGLKDEIRYAGPAKKLKYYIGSSMAHNDKKVLELFDETYVQLYERGVIEEILDKYFMESAELQ